jgi:hypothetical protein
VALLLLRSLALLPRYWLAYYGREALRMGGLRVTFEIHNPKPIWSDEAIRRAAGGASAFGSHQINRPADGTSWHINLHGTRALGGTRMAATAAFLALSQWELGAGGRLRGASAVGWRPCLAQCSQRSASSCATAGSPDPKPQEHRYASIPYRSDGETGAALLVLGQRLLRISLGQVGLSRSRHDPRSIISWMH